MTISGPRPVWAYVRDSRAMAADQPDDREKPRFSFRDGVWGDEPQEVDAAEFIEELEAGQPELARRWHDHPTIVPFKVVGRFLGRNGKRIGVTIAGLVVVLAGAAMLVLPGPGILVVIAGGTAEVLRLEVPDRRGGLDVLLPAVGAQRRALDRADAPRLHLQHQGVLAPHEPPDPPRLAVRRHQGRAAGGAPGEAPPVSGQAARRRRRRSLGAVPSRAVSAAL